MTDLRTAAQQALEALETNRYAVANQAPHLDVMEYNAAITALRAALSQQAEPVEPVAYIHRQGNHWEVSERFLLDDEKARGWTEEPLYTAPPQRKPQTIDEAMRLPRAMAQAYEAGYKAGAAAEREACAKVCEARFMGDMTREDMEARRCAAAIRARGNT